MPIVRGLPRLKAIIGDLKKKGRTIGFVPTMGALHEGHLSLIRQAAKENDFVVVSVFVNPIQFDRESDFSSYPRGLRSDARRAAEAGCDLIFAPSAGALYPPGFQTFVDVTRLSLPWEGRARPGHFRGVATVVAKLFNLVSPTRAYFGRKDAQQARLVQQLIEDLHFPVILRVRPTVRESGGLAMSSRNSLLSPSERRRASGIFDALQEGGRLIKCGQRRGEAISRRMRVVLRRIPDVKIDYVAVVNPKTLEPLKTVRLPAAILAAVWMGGVRLIDGCVVSTKKG